VLKVLDLYNRGDNALFVPEAGLNTVNAKYVYEIIARGGIGFSPFGIDDNGGSIPWDSLTKRLLPYASCYSTLSPMIGELVTSANERKLFSAVEADDHHDAALQLGGWNATVMFGGDGRGHARPVYGIPVGAALFIQTGDNSFLVTGSRCHITFQPTGGKEGRSWQYLKVEEGRYVNGKFELVRMLNGDETDWGGPGFGDEPVLLRITLAIR
jgi:hypothetical protein